MKDPIFVTASITGLSPRFPGTLEDIEHGAWVRFMIYGGKQHVRAGHHMRVYDRAKDYYSVMRF